MNSMYKEEILEHYKDPQNFGTMNDSSVSSKLTNPFCGDELMLFIKMHKVHKDSQVEEVSFIGKGCAISIAGASMLTEFAKGKTVKQLIEFNDKDMLDLLGIEVSETRKKCALLALAALKDCIK